MVFFALVYVVEGIGQTGGLIAQPLNYFLKQTFGWTPVQVTAYLTVLNLPWVIKPVYGVVSDFLPKRRLALLRAPVPPPARSAGPGIGCLYCTGLRLCSLAAPREEAAGGKRLAWPNRDDTSGIRLIRPRNGTPGQAFAIARDCAGGRDPHCIAMAHDMANRVTEGAQAKRLADDEGVHRDRED